MTEHAGESGAYSRMHDWEYRRWCSTNQMDPDSLDAVLAYEDLFDPTDDQATLDFTL
jgi:hypothetical protein